ncbi:serpin B9 isoform X2 [Ictidomys tridecemlineatus]
MPLAVSLADSQPFVVGLRALSVSESCKEHEVRNSSPNSWRLAWCSSAYRPWIMDSLSKANGTFAIQVLKTLCQDRPSQNVFFSPLSISSALAMVLLGAKGNTKVQMAQTFKESCLQFYHSKLERLSFAKATEKSRKHINTWVSKETKGKIPDLLPMNSIDKQARLVLVNAIYFKGTWNEPFVKSCTCEMPFKINQKEERPVQMMCQEAYFNIGYVNEVQIQVLELPYAGKELSMIILLPDDGVDLSSVENNLTFEKFIAWTEAASLQNTEVEVLLPRFKLQEDYEMKSVLQRLGMVDAFQRGQADLSAMSTETDLCLSKVVHKSVVEVNEEGTEAVAATGIVIVADCSACIPTFHADHPFLFFIRHNQTNTVLFCGRFSSP